MLTLSHYQLTELLYSSTHTIVYRAHCQTNNAPVILKLLQSDYPTPEAIARLKREDEINRRLSEKPKFI